MIQSRSSKDGNTVSRDQAIKYSGELCTWALFAERNPAVWTLQCLHMVCLHSLANPSDHIEPSSSSPTLSWQESWVLLEILRNL